MFDDAVAIIDSENPSKIIATGTGTATVTFTDNTSVQLTVTPADLTMFYLLGQSNAEGMDGDIAQSVVNEDGTAYSTYAPNNAWSGNDITGCEFTEGLSVQNATSFVNASLTGTKNVLGDELCYAPNSICESGDGKSGLNSATNLAKMFGYISYNSEPEIKLLKYNGKINLNDLEYLRKLLAHIRVSVGPRNVM